MHVHFVNENVGGHTTMHRHLRAVLAGEPDIEATFFDLDRENLPLRLVGASIPGLARFDLDLQVLRHRLAQSFLVRRELARLQEPPDVLHAYTQNTALLSVSHMQRTPTVVSIDSTNRQNAYRIPHRRPTRFTPLSVRAGDVFERRVFQAARRVVAHSRWAADAVLAYGIPAASIEVIPFGISVPAAVAERDPTRSPRILFVGTSMARKGGWWLLDLWHRRVRGPSTLVIVTHDRVPQSDGVEVHNDVHPGDGKLDAILAGCDVYVMPSEADAFGYSLLEAMAAGLPVVALRQAAVPEIVEHGVSGLLIEPGDDEGFARAVDDLLADADQRSALGVAARDRVVLRFDAAVTTRALLDVLRACARE